MGTGYRVKHFWSQAVFTLIFKPKLPFTIVLLTKTDETNDIQVSCQSLFLLACQSSKDHLEGFSRVSSALH